jgi:asparagine synthase (glutamine-hydrolysing)
MCGICGVLDYGGNLDLQGSIQRMTDLLVHRGPDGGGIEVDEVDGALRMAFGHRRLAIIDLTEAGRQPMRARGDLTVVLNGEIYNFRQKRLECAGFPFHSQTDTEVLLALYEKFGQGFVEHLDGMFALALWDGKSRRLLLARDRAGKKPLYYVHRPRHFAFASEMKALLALQDLSFSLDPQALPLYLTFGYVPTPDTIYSEIKKLEPGTLMIVTAGQEPVKRRYWDYPIAEVAHSQPRIARPHAEATLRNLLQNAVAKRMVADVPVGAFLSGGVDSSIIVGIMSGLRQDPVSTFSIGFEGDPAYDETSYAKAIAERFGCHHTEFRVRPRAVDLLQRLVWHYDEPFGDSSAIPMYIVSRLTREHVKVALSGDGGDELFAGYERFAATVWSERLPGFALTLGRWLTRRMPVPAHAKSTRRRIQRFFDKANKPLGDRNLEWNSFFTRGELAALLRRPIDVDVSASLSSCWRATRGSTLLQQLLHLNFHTYLLDDLLVKTDRMSMAHGLEVRCPFLDTQLVDWAATLPDNLKIRGGTLKYLLKCSYRDLLPRQILKRRKAGFGVPLAAWIRQDLKEYTHDLLLGASAKIGSLIHPSLIQSLLREHGEEIQDHGQRIWALLCLEVWLRNAGTANKLTVGCCDNSVEADRDCQGFS